MIAGEYLSYELKIWHACPRDSPDMTPEKCSKWGVVRVT